MLTGLEPEHFLEFLRNDEADQIGLVGFGHDLSAIERIEMLGHLPGRVGIGSGKILHHRQQVS